MMEGSQAAGADMAEWKEKRADILAKEAEERVAAEMDKAKVKTAEDLAREQMKKKHAKQEREDARLRKEAQGRSESEHIYVGDEIIKIGKQKVSELTNTQIAKKLEKAKRPVSVMFHGLRKLSDLKGMFWATERERIEIEVAQERKEALAKRREDLDKKREADDVAKKKEKDKADRKKERKEDIARKEREGMDFVYEVSFGPGPLGIMLSPPDALGNTNAKGAKKGKRKKKGGPTGCVVGKVVPGGQASKMGCIKKGHRPVRIGGQLVVKMKIKAILKLIGHAKRPLTMKLKGREKLKLPGQHHRVIFYEGPMGMKLVGRTGVGPMGGGVAVGHLQAGGYAERTGDVGIGDILNAFIDDEKRTEVRTLKLNDILKQIKAHSRPLTVEFVIPDLEQEKRDAREFEVAEEKRKAEVVRLLKEPEYTVTLTKKPHGLIFEPASTNAQGVASAGSRVKHVNARSEAAKLTPRPVRAGDRILSIGDRNVIKRPVQFAVALLRKTEYPFQLMLVNDALQKVREAEAIELRPLEKRFIVPEPKGGLERTDVDEDYDLGMGLTRVAGQRTGAQVQAVAGRGDAASLGIQRDWVVVRVAGMDVRESTLEEVREILSNVVRPFVIDFNMVTFRGKKKASGGKGGGKAARSMIGTSSKKLNVRALLWSAAPKALPQPSLSTAAENMVELIQEYTSPLKVLITNETCQAVSATETTFATLANALSLFTKVKSRSEGKIKPSILNILTDLTTKPAGLQAFANVDKLIATWIGFLWDAKGNPKVLNDLITQLHRVAQMPGIMDHREYQPLFVSRAAINLLNVSHGSMLRDKDGGGATSYIRLVEILIGIADNKDRLLGMLSSYYHKPGIPGLWKMLLKCKTPPILRRTARMLRLLTVDREGLLFSAYPLSTRPASVGEPPANVLHMLIMAMNRAQVDHGGFEFEYDFKEGPIGLRIDVAPGKRSGTVVKSVAPDSQADKAGIIEKNDIVLKIGKVNVEKFPLKRTMETLRSAKRPVTLEFRKPNSNDGAVAENAKFTIRFDSGPIGFKLIHLADEEPGARVRFIEANTQAATHVELKVGHVVFSVGPTLVHQFPYPKVVKTIQSAKRPVQITFFDPEMRSDEVAMQDLILYDILTILVRVLEHDSQLHEDMELHPERAAEIRSFHTFHTMTPQDAILVLELIFGRMLKRPAPDPAMCKVVNEAMLLCARADFVQTSSLYVPAFLHLNHLDEGESQPDYNVPMITGTVVNIMRIIDECSPIAVRIAGAGGIATVLRAFNRLRQAAEEGEKAQFSLLENEVLRWNMAMLKLMEEIMPHRDDVLSDVIADTCPALVANLFEVAHYCEIVFAHEYERLHSLIEHADEDGDGEFNVDTDNPAFAAEIRTCEERVDLIRDMESVCYAVIFEGCRVHRSCTNEISSPNFLPIVLKGMDNMTKHHSKLNTAGLYSLAHILSMICVDEEHIVLLFTPAGALTCCLAVLHGFDYILDTEPFNWKHLGVSEHIAAENHGGQEQSTIACLAQVVVQILRVVDIKNDLDERAPQLISTPVLESSVKLLRRTLRNAIDNEVSRIGPGSACYARCQQSLVLILYEFSTMGFFRARMSKLEVPRVCLEVLVAGRGLDKDTLVACAGTAYNIFLDSKARTLCQTYEPGSVLFNMCQMVLNDNVRSMHMKALLLASARSIVDSSRAEAMKSVEKMRFMVPLLIAMQGRASAVPRSTKRRPMTQENKMRITCACEARELMRLVTHVKFSDLRAARQSVVTGSKAFAAGTMSVAALRVLHKRRLQGMQHRKDQSMSEGERQHLGHAIANDNDMEEDTSEDPVGTLANLRGPLLEKLVDLTFDEYDNVTRDRDTLLVAAGASVAAARKASQRRAGRMKLEAERLASEEDQKSLDNANDPVQKKKRRKKKQRKSKDKKGTGGGGDEGGDEGGNAAAVEDEETLDGERWEGELDMIQWADIEYDTLKMASKFDREQLIAQAAQEEARVALEAQEGKTSKHAAFLTSFKQSSYTENITTVSKHADAIWGTVGYNATTTSSQLLGASAESFLSSPQKTLGAAAARPGGAESPERRFLPKVEAGASHSFMDQQDQFIQRQHDDRGFLREQLKKIRSDAYSQSMDAELAAVSRTSTGYKLDASQLASLAKDIVWGQGKMSPGRLPSLGTGNPMRSNAAASAAASAAEMNSARSSKRPRTPDGGGGTPGPKLRFLS